MHSWINRNGTMRWQLPASLLPHGAILLALVWARPAALPTPPMETGIDVEIINLARPLEPAGKVRTVVQISPRPAPHPTLTADRIVAAAKKTAAQKLAPATDGLIAATTLYSVRILEDPRSRSARRAMRDLAADERIIQLCNIEAMEQVHRWKAGYKPDYMIAYATTDLKLSGHEVQADGGAFHSRRDWYGIRFRCDV